MRLTKLALHGFRNLEAQQLEFPTKVTYIVGKNGQGKTNLLEAIYLLAHSKSFRTSKAADLTRWGVDSAPPSVPLSVIGELETAAGHKTIEYRVVDGLKRIFINEKKVARAIDFFGQVKAIEFTPDDLEICKGSPQRRRHFIDRILSTIDPGYVEHLVHYERALKSKNSLLLEAKRSGTSVQSSIRPWNTLLAKHGVKIAERRYLFITELEPLFTEQHHRLAASHQLEQTAALTYQSDFFENGAVFSEEQAREFLDQQLAIDFRQGKSTRGVHKDELLIAFTVAGEQREARAVASQGQARSLVLSLKLAAVDYVMGKCGEPPILLLDDVDSELDESRRQALKALIADSPCQVFVTTTELEHPLNTSSERVFAVNGGRVEVK